MAYNINGLWEEPSGGMWSGFGAGGQQQPSSYGMGPTPSQPSTSQIPGSLFPTPTAPSSGWGPSPMGGVGDSIFGNTVNQINQATQWLQQNPQNQQQAPVYNGPPTYTPGVVPMSNPSLGPTNYGSFQDGINRQTAMMNTGYNNINNQSLDMIYKQGLANWQENELVNPGKNGPRPVAPLFTSVDPEMNLKWLKSQTPGDELYGQDVGFDMSPYFQQNYKGVIAPWTTANTNFNLKTQNMLPQVGKPSSPDNPYGLLPADAYKWATGKEMPTNGYGFYDEGVDFNVMDKPLAQRGVPQGMLMGSPNGDGTGWWNPGQTNVTGYAGSAAQQAAQGAPGAGGTGGAGGAGQNGFAQWLQGMMGGGGPGGGFGYSQSGFSGGDKSYLEQWAKAANPISVTDAWEKMKESQQRGIDKGAADLAEQFNVMGGRFSTAFGDSMVDYKAQTAKDQNAALSLMQQQALENAFTRQFGAAGQLSQQDYGMTSLNNQLGNQRWLQENSQGFQSNVLDRNQAFQAAMYNAQAADQAANGLYQGSMYGANALNQGATYGATNMYNTANQAGQSLYNGQMSSLPAMLQAYLQNAGLNLSGAGAASGAYQGNLGLGGNLGGQQYGTLADQISKMYSEFVRTQGQSNPLMSLMQQMGLAQSSMYYPQNQPGMGGDLIGLAGTLLPILLGMYGGKTPAKTT